jgi:hypothetical protein
MQRLEEKSFASAGDRASVIQFVDRHNTELPWHLDVVKIVGRNMYTGS